MPEPFSAIVSLFSLANLILRIFNKIRTWLKNRDPLYRESNRFMKVLRDYAERNRHRQHDRLEEPYYSMAIALDERRRSTWTNAPGYNAAEFDAEEQGNYDSDGHVTEFAQSDVASDDEEDPYGS